MAGYAKFIVNKKNTNGVFTFFKDSGWHFVDDYKRNEDGGQRIHYNFRWTVTGLDPETEYQYYVKTRSCTHDDETESPIRTTFKTAPDESSTNNVVFTVVTGLDQFGQFKVFKSILDYDPNAIPDFNIFTGDTVYYDTQRFYPGMAPQGFGSGHKCLKRWNIWPVYYSYLNMMNFFKKIPNYWQVDDHDYWVNNINRRVNDGWQIFRNAHPTPGSYGTNGEDDEDYYNTSISSGSSSNFWRAIRWGKHLELFIEEGHHHRSGKNKEIWGTEQLNFLAEAIKKSEATFKVLVATTPLLGPPNLGNNVGDDKHSNELFDNETVTFMTNIFNVKNVYFVVGDRHWKYIAKIYKPGAAWNDISDEVKDKLDNIREYCCGTTGEDARHFQAPKSMDVVCTIGNYVKYDSRKTSTPGYMRVEVFNNNNNPKIVFKLLRKTNNVAFVDIRYDFASNLTHYVSLNNPTPIYPYTNWFTAAKNIQLAIDAAKDGDFVLVTNGIYSAGGAFSPNSAQFTRVMIDKDIKISSVNGAENTIIDGGGTNRCVYVCPYAEIKGFTLSNGLSNTN